MAFLDLLGGHVGIHDVICMNSINVLSFRPPEDYQTVQGYLEKFTVMVLHWSAAKAGQETKEEIIWNFVAKGTVLIDSIFSLWQKESFQDCWILSRALFARYIYLKDISERNEFEAFEQWSNQMQFNDAYGWPQSLDHEMGKIRCI